MRILRAGIRPIAALLALLLAATSAVPSAAHPPDGPDHGVGAETYYTLWSGDGDDANASDIEQFSDGSAAAMRALAATTDIPLDAPPAAVERWNRGDHGDFPTTDGQVSVHPPGADLEDGVFLRDAYAAVFAVQPSTRALVSESDQPLYVAPVGELLGTVDYRVELPRDSTGPNRTVDWRLLDHGISETRLDLDGATIARGPGTHTPALAYEAVDIGTARSLTLEADIEIVVGRRVRTCGAHEPNSSVCIGWNVSVDRRTETLTVGESVEILPYELVVTGAWGRYPEGDLGLVLYRNQPWLGYSLPGGSVRGIWRFYSARDDRWDRLIERSDDGSRSVHSPMHPLQVHAYPFEPGPTATPRDTITILESYGLQVDPPTLPSAVHLDTIEEPYTSSYGIVTRTDSNAAGDWDVSAEGLVRGIDRDVALDDLRAVPIHESRLELAVLDSTPETVTVEVALSDASTGEPISTAGRRGYVVLEGEPVETDELGTATRTMPRPMGALSARFVPGPWWPEPVGYVGDSDVVYVRGTVLQALAVVYEVGIPVALFLMGVFLIDRITGWRVWPPWRRL